MKLLAKQAPWPLLDRLDQRDERMAARPKIKPYGCAMMLCCEVGRYLKTDLHGEAPPYTPDEIIALRDEAIERGILGPDCFIQDWDRMIDLVAARNAVDYLGHKSADYPFSSEEIVLDCWERQDRNVGKHFTWTHPSAGIQYDPLGSAEPGLSWSRKLGIVVSRRAFRIL